MTADTRRSAIRVGTLALGLALFASALHYIKVGATLETIRRLGIALPLAILLSGLWHLARTWAWARCFPQPRQVGFLHLARVRLSAEAFSYLTFGAIVGEPLKVVLLSGSVDARQAAAAVALERLAFLVGTTIIVGVGAVLAMVGLPLTPLWFRVFRAFAFGAAAVSLLTIVVVFGLGTYCPSLFRRIDAALPPSFGEGQVARFTSAVKRQLLDLVRGNPTRLLVLVAATGASYLLMALEAYVIVRASGASFTPNGALAVETFSRVASFASAFIPANLGALEASSVVAVTAVGAAGGGAALALARRLRGLFWAGVGLAIYPRPLRAPLHRAAVGDTQNGAPATLLYFPNAPSVSVPASAKLAGLAIAERAVRAAVRAGYSRIVVWAPESANETSLARLLRRLALEMGQTVRVATVPREWDAAMGSIHPADSVTIVSAGIVVSPALLGSAREMTAEAGRSLDVAAGPEWPESGVVRMTAGDARDREQVAKELAARRQRALPQPSGVDVSKGRAMLAIRIGDPAELAAAEETIRRATYKDTDAKIARFNRRISLPISVKLIRTPLTANQLSVILVAIGFYSAWLFSAGHYRTGILGAFLSLAASVLDGCDGEIARLKYQESALGCWIETFGDYSYYLAIFAGLTVGAVHQTHWDVFYWLGGIALAGTLLSFGLLIFLRSRITAGSPEKLHAVAKARFQSEPTFWSRIVWRMSFVATRAAMPYGIMTFSLVYALPGIVVLAAIGANVYWISLVMKMRHLLGSSEVGSRGSTQPRDSTVLLSSH
jgi:phosphatidylglycerophosphate synthase